MAQKGRRHRVRGAAGGSREPADNQKAGKGGRNRARVSPRSCLSARPRPTRVACLLALGRGGQRGQRPQVPGRPRLVLTHTQGHGGQSQLRTPPHSAPRPPRPALGGRAAPLANAHCVSGATRGAWGRGCRGGDRCAGSGGEPRLGGGDVGSRGTTPRPQTRPPSKAVTPSWWGREA